MQKKRLTQQQRTINANAQVHMRSLAPNLLPGVTPDHLEDIVCEHCAGIEFSPVHLLKSASPLQTQNSQPTLVQFPLGFKCNTCGQINKMIKKSDLEAKLAKEKNPDIDNPIA